MTVDTVSGEQFAGLVDGGSRLVRHVVEIDADVTGVTQVLQEMLLDVGPRATVVQLPDATLALIDIALLVNNLYGFRELGILRNHIVQQVAELRPSLTTTDRLEKGIGDTDILLDIFLQCQSTVLGQSLIDCRTTFNGGKSDKLYLLDAAGTVGHNLTRDIDNAIHHTLIVTIIGIELTLALVEMYKESIFLFAKDAGTVIRTVGRDMLHHRILLLKLSSTSLEVGNRSQSRDERLLYYRNQILHGWLSHDGFFHLTRTTRDVKDNAHTSLGQDKDFMLGAYLGTTMAALVTIELGITEGCTNMCLQIPIAT